MHLILLMRFARLCDWRLFPGWGGCMMDPVEELARTQEDIYNTEKEIERVKEEGPRLIAELESRLTILQLREVSLL